jgi:PAS domain S-box-containing protein
MKNQKNDDLQQVAWMLEKKDLSRSDFVPYYGDLSLLNQDGPILTMVGREMLQEIVSDYLDLLGTSGAVYERNGDYALGIFTSGWCQLMDSSSRKLCNTESNLEALKSGKWLCHESCWKDASMKCMQEGKPVDVSCAGGLRLYAVPVKAEGRVIGAINFGYGDPPSDEAKLKALSIKYDIPLQELQKQSGAYKSRPPFIIDLAKHQITKSAKYIGNIIEQKLAKKAAQENEQKLRITLDSIGDAVIATDTEARITRMNPEAERLCGCMLEQAKGKNLTEVFNIVNALTGEKAENPVKKALRTGRVVDLANDTMLISKDGNEYQIADSASPIRDEQGIISGVVMVFRDVTEEYLMREELKASNERYRTVFANTGTATCLLEHDGTISLANSKFVELAGYSLEEIQNKKKWMEFVIAEDLEKMRAQHELRRKNREQALREYEFKFVRADKEIRHIYLQIDVIEGTDKSVASLLDITGRKQAEMRLKDSEEKHRRLFETMSQGVVYQAADGSIISANPATEKMLGLSLDQMQGKTSVDPRWKMIKEDKTKVPGKDHPTMIALRTGKKVGPVIRGIHIPEKDKYVWLSITATPLFKHGEDKPFQAYAVFDDITGKKLSQQRMQESEERFQRMLSLIPDMISIHDKDFNIVYSNWNGFASVDEAKRKLYTKCHKTYRGMDDICPDCQAKAVLKTKTAFQTEAKLPDGTWIDLRVIPVLDKNGEVELFVEWVREITDHKETENTKQVLLQIANEILHNFKLNDFIKVVEQQLSKIVDTTNFYIALYDAETGLLSAPFEKDEKDQIDTWPAKGSATGLVIEKKQSVILTKQDVTDLIESGKIKQTGSICESWLGVPLFKGTDVSGVIVVQSYDKPEAFDSKTVELFKYVSNQISMALERTRVFEDLLHAKNKAEESDRLKSAFLANMSHEIRTPMNGILGFAELLKEPQLTDEQQDKYIEIIEKSGERMLSIINDIVDISRIESGLMDVSLAESDVNEQLKYINTFFKPEVEAKGMQIVLSSVLPAEHAKVVTDREKLFAVLTNLVKNAIKYSKEGFIEYGCKKQGSFLEFFIKDTGIGIQKDRQQAIFSRFIQADIEDIEARQGAGLGLAIAKAYVEMLGGEIWVESEEGQGSTFYFTIPVGSQ